MGWDGRFNGSAFFFGCGFLRVGSRIYHACSMYYEMFCCCCLWRDTGCFFVVFTFRQVGVRGYYLLAGWRGCLVSLASFPCLRGWLVGGVGVRCWCGYYLLSIVCCLLSVVYCVLRSESGLVSFVPEEAASMDGSADQMMDGWMDGRRWWNLGDMMG